MTKGQRGYFGQWGGAFIPEVLQQTFSELNTAYRAARADKLFWQEYVDLMGNYSCRPTPLTFAENLSNHLGGARIYIKREDLNHTGAHKANNVMGQGLLVRRMGKKRVIARQEQGSTGLPQQQWRLALVLTAPSTWARWTWPDSGPMFFGWKSWAPLWYRSRTVPEP